MPAPIVALCAAVQFAYLAALLVTFWLYSQPVDLLRRRNSGGVDMGIDADPRPEMIVLYPVLRELEATMRTSMLGFERAGYAGGRRRVIAIPNADDAETLASLERLSLEYDFLEIMAVPPCEDPSWSVVWRAWDSNQKAYWWHQGRRAHERALPAKKTRQLVYAFYTLAESHPDAILSYIDADSVVPADYFDTAAEALTQYDVVQNTNVAGNALESWATTMFAMDHMLWDGSLYQHMTASGRHPFYVLGKGLFFRFSDLIEFGGFNPWLTIEDPEVGMRLWVNGRRLGIVRSPLIEEVPDTFAKGITQRKRWIAGFFQSLGAPLRLMGMTRRQRIRARLNLVPCGSLLLNPIGAVLGIWTLVAALTSTHRVVPLWVEVLCLVTLAGTVTVMAIGQRAAFRQTAFIFSSPRSRLLYMLRVNPGFLLLYWLWWAIPLAIGFRMYLRDEGLTWERTDKIDANHDLVRDEAIATIQAASLSNSGTPE